MIEMFATTLALLASEPVACAGMLEQQRDAALKLNYEQFDQTEGSGFRVLARAGCQREAADLIEDYVAATGATESSLTWHVAQLRAEAGQTAASLVAARKVIRADEAVDARFKWNDYVRAFIAFQEKDRAAFDLHRARVNGAASLHAGNALNGKLLDMIGAHFDSSYLDAQRLSRE